MCQNRDMNYLLGIIGIISLTIYETSSFAHSGGLNQQGCHNNRKTGGYHCHRGSSNKTSSPFINKRYDCRITLGDQYYDFNPANTKNLNLNFKSNNGKLKLNCN